MPGPTLFDVPATGELFDTRPYDAPVAAVATRDVVPAHPCPSCGRDTATAVLCAACVERGHMPGVLA